MRYRLHWCVEPPFRPDLGRSSSRPGRHRGHRVARSGDPDLRKLVIDFAGGQLEDIPADAPGRGRRSAVLAGRARSAAVARKNPVTGGWRVVFDLRPEGDGPVELRCLLLLAGETLTETWVYQWTP